MVLLGKFIRHSLCFLQGLVDLNTEKESVQARIADYLTDLISIGFSGFR
jgi:alpha-amylase